MIGMQAQAQAQAQALRLQGIRPVGRQDATELIDGAKQALPLRGGAVKQMKAADLIKELVWEEVADDLSRESGVKKVLCLGEDFYAYLNKEAKLPFKLEKASSKAKGGYGLIIGWGILPAKGPPTVLKRIYKLLKKSGEVRLWGFYNQPHRDDLAVWERKLRKREKEKSFPGRLPGAISLARISGCIRKTPFEHYIIRKKGICYQALFKK